MKHFRSYNPGRDDRWGVRGRKASDPTHIQDVGVKMEETNGRHKEANGGRPLQWYRCPTPLDSMKPEDRQEAELLAHAFPGTNEIRTDGKGARWWHLRTTTRMVSMTGLLPAIEQTTAAVAAGE